MKAVLVLGLKEKETGVGSLVILLGWLDSVTAGERLEVQELPLYRRRNSAMYQKRGNYPLLAGLDLLPQV